MFQETVKVEPLLTCKAISEAPPNKSLHWPPGRICHTSCNVIISVSHEVRQLLEDHADQMAAGIEYHEMFKLVKAKLARERKLIL